MEGKSTLTILGAEAVVCRECGRPGREIYDRGVAMRIDTDPFTNEIAPLCTDCLPAVNERRAARLKELESGDESQGA